MRLDKYNLATQIGRTLEILCVITDITIRPSKNGEYALYTVIAGKAKEKIKWWGKSYSPEEIEERKGRVVMFTVRVEEYDGRPSLIAEAYEDLNMAATTLLPCDTEHVKTFERFRTLINGFENKDGFISNFTVFVFEECLVSFAEQPAAATHHHNFLGGLLLHSVETAEIAKAMALSQHGTNTTRLNVDLIVAAALMHDIGKLEELKLDRTTGEITYTMKGSLFGHAVLGYDYLQRMVTLYKACDSYTAVDEEHMLLLLHILLAHHGQQELGAVVSPALLEGKIVHAADMFSCGLYKHDLHTAGIDDGTVKSVWEFNRLVNYYKSKEQ